MSSTPEREKARILAKMKADWNRRSRENGSYYIATNNSASELEFHESGGRDVYYVFRHLEYLLSPEQIVLDIGCGIGRMDAHVAPRVRKLVGLDVSGDMVAGARKRLSHLGNVEFVEGDGCSLHPLADGSFDLVFSHIVFQHMPREAVEGYVGEVHRVLRPGGHFVFQVPEALEDVWPDPALDDTFEMRFYREIRVREMVVRSGLEWHGAARFRVNATTLSFDQLQVHASKPAVPSPKGGAGHVP